MIKLSEIKNAYVFIHTSDKNVIQKVDRLTFGMNFQKFGQNEDTECLSGIFYNNSSQSGKNKFYGFDKINDLGDYDLGAFQFEKNQQLNNKFDSIISYCFIQEKNFIAGTDYLSLFKHFYYYKDDTFICSNNVFVVAKLCGESISEEAIFETLFFRFPYKNLTYFKNIKSLNPYQQLCFNKEQGLFLSTSISYSDLLLEDNNNISERVNHFFSGIKNPEELPAVLSFSGGSDSTALLAILKARKYDCQLVSFKGHNDWDTRRIKNLSKKAGCSFIFIDPIFGENTEQEKLQYTFLTNGYSTSIKFYDFYKRIPEKCLIFDGYSMMHGDMSDATLYPPFKDVLQGIPIEFVLEKYFSGFDAFFLKRMKDYLTINYQDQFLNINTNKGLRNIQQYCVEGVMSKVYSGVLQCPVYFGHQNVSFYFSREYITYMEKNGYGIARTCAGRDDYPGYFVNRRPLAEIASKMDSKIYQLKLDHGFSFKDINENHRYPLYKKKLNSLDKKIFDIFHKKKQKEIPRKVLDTKKFEFINSYISLNKYAQEGLSLIRDIENVIEKI